MLESARVMLRICIIISSYDLPRESALQMHPVVAGLALLRGLTPRQGRTYTRLVQYRMAVGSKGVLKIASCQFLDGGEYFARSES